MPRTAGLLALAAITVVASCASGGAHATTVGWTSVRSAAFAGADITVVLPGDAAHPWLVGGSRSGAVAIWWASAATGPWYAATFTTVSGDGPSDTILGLARSGAVTAAFGSHASPIHGNPRPSPWTSADGGRSWSEVPTLRELFGGENIVGLGALTGGPHGLFVAGTWVNHADRAVATVWRSTDGRRWTRNDSDPALAGGAGELTEAAAVGDAASGVVAVGSALVPTLAAPAGQRGALWASDDGAAWSRVDVTDRSLNAGDGQVQVERVEPSPTGGWIAAGVRTSAGRAQVVVWTWGAGVALHATPVGSAVDANGALAVGGLAVTPSAVLVTASTVLVTASAAGRPLLWAGHLDGHGRAGQWRAVTPPAAAPPSGLRAVLVASAGGSTVVALRGISGSQLWTGALG